MNIRPALPLEVAVAPRIVVGLADRDLIVAGARAAMDLLFKLSPFEMETEGRGFGLGLEFTLKPLNPVMLTIRITGPNFLPLPTLLTETGIATGPTDGRVVG
jgi:hypothetical protein